MIEKVNSVSPRINRLNYNAKSVSTFKNVNSASTQLPGRESNSYFKALNNISFKAGLQNTSNLSDLEFSFITKEEIRIPNILDLNENIDIPRKKMPQGTENLNAAGLNVEKTTNGNRENYLITNDKGDKIFEGEFYRNGTSLPVITYKQGKYMPEITIKDSSKKGKSIKMYAGSIMEGENFKIKMPGTCYPNPSSKKGISFKGNTVITTLNKEPRTLAAVDKYFNSGLQNEAVFGDYADEVAESDPIVVIPAGGFGERFKNITREKTFRKNAD